MTVQLPTCRLGVTKASRPEMVEVKSGGGVHHTIGLAELDRTYVSGIERGERNPSLTNLLKLATALDIQVSELATRAEALLAE